jgi:3-oxoacyl-[acyl-carrier-protein] synthase I
LYYNSRIPRFSRSGKLNTVFNGARMKTVYINADNIVSPIGFTTRQNFEKLQAGESGIHVHDDIRRSLQPFQASLFSDEQLEELYEAVAGKYSLFERLMILSARTALEQTAIDPANGRTVFIISSTKGNIAMIENRDTSDSTDTISLHHSAKVVAEHFGNSNLPIVISSACISGVLALITGKRLIESGLYDHAIVVGADLITRFILSGFQSFQAVSGQPCRPFDKSRDGVTLGEGAATVILSSEQPATGIPVSIGGGSTSNDANHISGPSRTGEPLYTAISKALRQANISAEKVGFISAHGTATIFNDEMEAKAISLAGLELVPVNSLKGYYGHTLGAAGLIEVVISVQSLRENKVIATKGFTESGVSKDINICSTIQQRDMQYMLKTASGFGGCNAAIVLEKHA